MDEEVAKNKQQQQQYKQEFEEAIQHNETEIKQLLEVIELRYEERIQRLENVQINCKNNLKEINELCGRINEFENNNISQEVRKEN